MPISYDDLRSTARRLGRFTRGDIAAHLGISPNHAGKRLEELVLEGIIQTPENPEERVRRNGVGRPQHVYEYVSPGNSPGNFSRSTRPTPEAEVIARVSRSRGDVVSGKKIRGARPETDRLIKEVRANGGQLKKGKHGHKVLKDGKVVGSIPNTPSDHRSTKNTRADLKRAGLAA